MVEIAKALSIKARLVILDEPTSSLPLAETDKLLDVIKALKADGISVIFISHRLHEVERVADRVVVLRDGMLAGTLPKSAINHDQMVKLMIGRMLKEREKAAEAARAPGARALSAKAVRTRAYPDRPVDLDVRHGEILGLAGLVGSGRTELARVLFGIDETLRRQRSSSTASRSRSARPPMPSRSGIFLVPEDRKLTGILLDLSIAQNISLPNLPAHAQALAGLGKRRDRHRREAEEQSRHQGAVGADAHRHAVGRQPAEGGAGQMAGDEPEGDDPRRADARHRHRRQGRDLRADAGAGRCRRRRADDLQRHGGGDRRLRPHRRHA